MECYLDNSATTRCSEAAAKMVAKVLTEDYGNPSSLHNKGMEAEQYIKESREIIAKSLKVDPKEIVFTSGGSESNNLAIFGACHANKRIGKHVITTSIEHPSVAQPMKALEEMGYEVTYLPVDHNGVCDLQMLADAIREDTVLVSMMHVNNEIGTIEPIEDAARIIHERNENTLFHVDAIQSYGKVDLYPKKSGIDLVSVSGHKLHGPKGSGFLYVKDKVKLAPVIYGGGQEWGRRSGTENVPAIAGLGVAVSEMFHQREEHIKKLRSLKDSFIKQLETVEGISFNGPLDESSAPQILSVSVEGVRAEVMLHALEDKGVYCSAGSACSSNRPSISRTLTAIGLKKELLDATVRFSFSIYTTQDEVDQAAKAVEQLAVALRKYRRY
ncbi:cysteine desulfurase [Lachnospiraceae bacterium C10]|nr:cysteine desulfurase [Lachnospiraceae bacterium C10]